MRILNLFIISAVFCILITILPSFVSADERDKPMVGSPNISIVIDQDTVQVSVEPGETGQVRFTGTVFCDLPPTTPPGQYCVVQLIADAGGWPASNPPSMVFDRTIQEADFEVTVQVPIESSMKTQAQFSVSGRWNYSPGATGGTIPASTSIIEVLGYSKPVLTVISKNNTLPVGKWGEIEIEVMNGGNSNDDVKLEIIDLPDGVTAYFQNDNLIVPEKQSETAILKVKQSSGAPKLQQIVVTGKGRYNGTRAMDQETITFETTISAKSLVTTSYFIIPFLIILVAAGVTIYIFVRKRNRNKVTVRELV